MNNNLNNNYYIDLMESKKKYLEAVDVEVEFDGNIPVDMDKYLDKVKRISQGIEECWMLFSLESQQFFFKVGYELMVEHDNISSFPMRIIVKSKLLLKSILTGRDLYSEYRDSLLSIPRAIRKAANREMQLSKN